MGYLWRFDYLSSPIVNLRNTRCFLENFHMLISLIPLPSRKRTMLLLVRKAQNKKENNYIRELIPTGLLALIKLMVFIAHNVF